MWIGIRHPEVRNAINSKRELLYVTTLTVVLMKNRIDPVFKGKKQTEKNPENSWENFVELYRLLLNELSKVKICVYVCVGWGAGREVESCVCLCMQR